MTPFRNKGTQLQQKRDKIKEGHTASVVVELFAYFRKHATTNTEIQAFSVTTPHINIADALCINPCYLLPECATAHIQQSAPFVDKGVIYPMKRHKFWYAIWWKSWVCHSVCHWKKSYYLPEYAAVTHPEKTVVHLYWSQSCKCNCQRIQLRNSCK